MGYGIKRRRKRNAVDPCLGYYEEDSPETRILQNPSIPVNTSPAGQKGQQISKSPAPYRLTALSNAGNNHRQVGVEEFLRTNAARPPALRAKLGRLCPTQANESAQENFGGTTTPPSSSPPLSNIEFEVSPMARPGIDFITGQIYRNSGCKTDLHAESDSEKRSLPDIAVLEYEPSSEDPDSLPFSDVESLRLRSRTVKWRRIVEDESDSDADDGSDFGKESPPVKKTQKPTKNKKYRTKSLGTRLFEACAATDGDPLDSLVVSPAEGKAEASGGSAQTQRKPLQFSPEDSSRASSCISLGRRAFLVDPWRIDPLRDAYFATRRMTPSRPKAAEMSHQTHRSLSNWMPILEQHMIGGTHPEKRVRRKRGLGKGDPQIPEVTFHPLHFVPLAESQVGKAHGNAEADTEI